MKDIYWNCHHDPSFSLFFFSSATLKANMNSKADLKTAREAIGKKDFGEAVKACKRVLLWEGENYNAYVILLLCNCAFGEMTG